MQLQRSAKNQNTNSANKNLHLKRATTTSVWPPHWLKNEYVNESAKLH